MLSFSENIKNVQIYRYIFICTKFGRQQKKFSYHNRKMVKLRLRSDMIEILLINHEGRITVLKQRNYGNPRSNYASDMQPN